ncbi:MAG: prefoldin subunit beta [Halobacteriales archaeon]
MSAELPPEAQEKLQNLQELQEQLTQLNLQRQQTQERLSEIERALDALEEADEDASIYRTAGGVMVEAAHDEVNADLEEEQETLEVRSQSLENKEERARERFQGLQQEVQQMLGGAGLGGPAQ